MKKILPFVLLSILSTPAFSDNLADFQECRKTLNGEVCQRLIPVLEKDCSKDDLDSCAFLGIIYFAKKNFALAAEFAKKGSMQNTSVGAECSNIVSVLYYLGLGLDKDLEMAAAYARNACRMKPSKRSDACERAAKIYFQGGKGVAKDYSEAFSLYELSCDKGNGNPKSCANLGFMYEYGLI